MSDPIHTAPEARALPAGYALLLLLLPIRAVGVTHLIFRRLAAGRHPFITSNCATTDEAATRPKKKLT